MASRHGIRQLRAYHSSLLLVHEPAASLHSCQWHATWAAHTTPN